jgi:hypothetical protein
MSCRASVKPRSDVEADELGKEGGVDGAGGGGETGQSSRFRVVAVHVFVWWLYSQRAYSPAGFLMKSRTNACSQALKSPSCT